MNKIISTTLALVILFGLPQLKATGIAFEEGSWEQVLKKAQKEEKYIFVDCMTTWCGPCKHMAKNVFTLPEVASFYNQNFINVKLDMEKGDGKVLAKKFSIAAFPTFAFFNGTEELIWRTVGACSPADFVAHGQKVLDGVNPVQKMYDKYASGDYDREFLYKYLLHCDEKGMDYEKPLAEYLKGMDPANLMEEGDYEIFNRFVTDTDSEFFREFEDNLDAFKEKYGEKEVKNKYHKCWMATLNDGIGKNDQKKVDQAVEKLEAVATPYSMIWIRDFLIANKFRNFSQEEGYAQIKEYLDQDLQVSTMTLNNRAWEICEKEEKKKWLKEGIRWAEIAFEEAKMDDRMASAILDTWGMLLAKKGDLKEAVVKLEASVLRGKKANEDVSLTEEALEKVKAELGN